MSIYHRWGLQPIINVSGAVTRLGGAPMPPEVLRAFVEAADESVPLESLQAAASREIARVTGGESGLVTAGSAAALTLGAAAILTGYDARRMESLPFTEEFPNEFVVAREQRNGYDHAVRAAGVRFVEVGFHEMVAGAGVRRAEAWEYAAAFGPKTAGVFYVYGQDARPSLAEVVAAAHSRQLPVLVDAAGELPPRSNLKDILATGVDLVAFSGGKAIRGPQATGILCGRRELVAAAALQMLDMDDHYELWDPPPFFIDKSKLRGFPRHGIGRSMKVSKEQIVALLTALQLFVEGNFDHGLKALEGWLSEIARALSSSAARCSIDVPSDGECLPVLEIMIDSQRLDRSALEICRSLRNGNPPIYVGHGKLDQGKLVVNPLHLNEERCGVLIERLQQELQPRP